MSEPVNHQRLAKNGFIIASTLPINGISLLAAGVLTARYLGLEEFGIFTFILLIARVLQVVVNGGIVNITVRTISQTPDDAKRLLSGALSSLTFIMGIAACIIIVVAYMLDDLEHKSIALLLIFSVFVNVIAAMFGALLRAFEEMGAIALTSILTNVVLVGLIFLCSQTNLAMTGIAICYVVAALINWGILVTIVGRRHFLPRWSLDLPWWKELWSQSLPLGLSMFARRANAHVNIILLAFLATVTSVGLFNVAYQTVEMLGVAILGICAVLYPALTRQATQSEHKLADMLNVYLRLCIVGIIPISFGLFVLSEFVTGTVYGASFQSAAPSFAILNLSLVFTAPSAVMFYGLLALSQQKTVLTVALLGLATNLIMNLLLIPNFDVEGAAVASLLGELAVLVGNTYFLRQYGLKISFSRPFFQGLLAVIPAAFIFDRMITDFDPVWAAGGGIAFLIVYLLLCIGTGLIKLADLRLITKMLKQKND